MISLIFKNSSSNVLTFVVKIVITLVMTPILIKNLGNYDYGIWEVTISVIGYMGLLDIGLRPTASRFAAHHNSLNNHKEMLDIYSSCISFMLCLSVILCAMLIMIGVNKPEWITQTQDNQSRYTIVIVIIAVHLVILFPGQICESFLEGLQKYHVKNKVTLVNSILGSIVIYNYIDEDNALILLAAVNSIGVSIKYAIFYYILYRSTEPGLTYRVKNTQLSTLKELYQFGVKTFIQGVATRITTSSHPLIVAYALSPEMVIFYTIPASLIRYVVNIIMLITHAFMPLFSEMNARKEHTRIVKWYISSTRLINGIVIPIGVFIIFYGVEFIDLWIGQEYAEKSEGILFLLTMTLIVSQINSLNNRYLTAIDKHGYLAIINSYTAVISIVLGIFLTIQHGLIGLAISALIPITARTLLVINYTVKNLEISSVHFYKECVLPSITPAIALCLFISLLKMFYLINSFVELIFAVLLSALVYLPLYYFVVLNIEERKLVLGKIKLS